ncbi:MAG: PEP-CTERM system TPR-repeat protein PrsT [Alphaproteobacteria bacterium]
MHKVEDGTTSPSLPAGSGERRDGERLGRGARGLGLALALACLSVLGAAPPLAAGYLEDARQELANDDPRTAIIHLRNALKDDPDDVEARILLGELLLQQGKITAARDHLNRAFELAPSGEIAALLGYALLAEGEGEAAFLFAQRQERQFAQDPGRLPLLKAEALMSLQKPDEARAALAPYLRDHPLDVDALVVDARLDLAAGALTEASAAIARALEVDGSSLAALWGKIDVDSTAGRFDLAHTDIDRLAEEAPGDPQIEVARAGIFVSAGRLNEAKTRLQAVLAARPAMPSAALLLAMIFAAEGDYDSLQAILAKLDRKTESSKPYLLLSGIANAVAHRYATAETLLSDYVAQAPGDHAARRLLGNVQLNAGLDSSVITTLEPLAALSPPNITVLQMLASAQIRAGRLPAAQVTLARIAEHGHPAAAAEAKTLLAALDDAAPGAGRGDLARVLDHLHYGDSGKALAILDRLAAERPDDPAVLNLLGITRFRSGDEAGARTAFEKVLALEPGHLDARRALDQLDFRAGRTDVLAARLHKRLAAGDQPEQAALDLAALIAGEQGDEAAYDFLVEQAAAQPASIGLREALVHRSAALGRPVRPWIEQLLVLGGAGDAEVLAETLAAAGRLAERYGETALAAEAFARRVQATPEDPDAHVALARAAYGLGRIDQARASTEAAIALDPAHDTANRILVELDLQAGDEKGALAHIERLEAEAPALGRELLAFLQIRAGRPEQGFAILEDALARYRDPALAHALFLHRRQAGLRDDAIEGLRAWLVRQPGDALAMDLLGDTYSESGDLELALRYYEQAVGIAGDDPALLNDLSWVRHALGMPGAAESAKRAYVMAPVPEIADTLGWILTGEGDVEDGLPLLREAFAARSDDPTIRYHLGHALAEAGRPEEARATLRDLAETDRPFAERAQALALFERLAAAR